MKVFSTPAEVLVDPSLNLTSIVERHRADSSNPVLYRRQMSPGNWQPVRAQQFHQMVTDLAKGMIAAGIRPGDRVGIMSRTRFEWTVIDFAIWYAGAVSVPVYETNAAAQAAWALSHSEAVAIFVEDEKLLNRVAEAEEYAASTSEPCQLKHRWVIENGDLDTLSTRASEVSDERLEQVRSAAGCDDLATIVYTSGTTGRPKGCPLTHGNFLNLSANTRFVESEIANPRNSSILFLPLAHVLARLIQVLALDAGVVIGHSPNIKNLAADLDSFKPTMLLVVPRVFEKVYEGAKAKAEKGGSLNKALFDRSVDIAIAWSKAKVTGHVSFKLAAQYALYDRLVYSKLRAALGGQLHYAVSGGGPLGERLAHFFHAVGVQVIEGYGLTETCAPIAAGRITPYQIGRIGPLLPGAEGTIAEDGELLVRGVGVMKGYYKNPEEDAQAFTEDGWLRTGDLAEFDEAGLLKIVGRKKEIIVTAGGKNVIPGIAENHLRTSPLVSQAMLVGDEKPFIAALVTLDPDTLPEQLEHLGLPRSLSIPEAAVHPAVRAAVQRIVDEANQLVSRAEGIREFRIMNRDLTEEDGYLTPSHKIRRAKVLQDFSSYVDEMYGKVSDSTSDSLARLQEYAAEQSEKFAELREQAAERLHEYADHQAERLAELREQAAEKFEELREQTAEMMQKPQEEKVEAKDDAKKSDKSEKAEDSSAEAPAEKTEAKKAEKKSESDNA
ncbi:MULTISPECIES: AMP-dependent synthetase/ligase [Rothia]|uniref:AMP-dependent synthetase/ligase n=1 Tax=Rothia TaxID=32207 RepID=UPI00066A61FA|nr:MULTISPECIES: AMP-binding protein [Rothia]OFR64104.1 long-chain fatty acid--CoA ligase [Rothia sp. HMSC069C04]